jgi:salicylate hydroxylase
MVAFVPTNLDTEESWTAPGDLKTLAAEYAGWDDPVLETIGALDHTFRWGIYDRVPLPYWSTGRMTTSQIRTMARDAGRLFRAEYEDVAERDRLMANVMAAIGRIPLHDAEKTAQEALPLAGNDEAIG